MDFELSEEHLAFKEAVRKWVEKEAPKAWARELERDEHHYPFELWQKFSEAGFHGIGIKEEYGGQGGDIVMQMILGRELARTLGRSRLDLGHHLLRRQQVDRHLRLRGAEEAVPAGNRRRTPAGGDLLHRARRRH